MEAYGAGTDAWGWGTPYSAEGAPYSPDTALRPLRWRQWRGEGGTLVGASGRLSGEGGNSQGLLRQRAARPPPTHSLLDSPLPG